MSDREAIAQLRDAAGGDKETVLLHYIYFPAKGAATKAEKHLKEKGFDVESRLGADGANWLVLARHRVVPDAETVGRARETLEKLAGNFSGEYDGWEAEVE